MTGASTTSAFSTGERVSNKRDDRRVVATNRRARYDYEIDETFEAGLALLGTEVKSLRDGHVTLGEGFVRIEGGEAWLMEVTIPEYKYGNLNNHAPRRPRKLLMNRHELDRVAARVREKGYTAVPMEIYFKAGWAKLLFGLGKGKKLYDKRQAEKEKVSRREARDQSGAREH